MILMSLDPVGKTAAVLSIPRDLWVAYPTGLGDGKINSANRVGDLRQYPGGGPELAKQTVGGLLGIRVHYYVLVNFDAFITFVNVIGDITVCPAQPIDDPKYPDGSYGYKPIYIEAGCQPMGPERLLEYSRTRATTNGDFDRSQRQQEVIMAIRQKIMTTGGASSLLENAFTIWESVQANVRTDLSPQELIELAALAETIPSENIRQAAVGPGEVLAGISPTGEDILIPITSDILALVADLFRPAGAASSYTP
jgi:LCP family protein required for cell wall assembly